MILFDGYQVAQQRELQLGRQVQALLESGGRRPKIAALLFAEDTGSQLYTRLKRDAATRAGIGYEVHEFALSKFDLAAAHELLDSLNADETITGIIIQKPWRSTWMKVTHRPKDAFANWWHALTERIDPLKDVDGLHPTTLAAIQAGTWKEQGKVLPATCRAVLSILEQAGEQLGWGSDLASALADKKVIILGKSDLLGVPLFAELQNHGVTSELIVSAEFARRSETDIWLRDADVVISATGRMHLITGEAVRQGVVVIDVGEPHPDVERASVEPKAAFLTPVPGGVGPMTVVSLLENSLSLA